MEQTQVLLRFICIFILSVSIKTASPRPLLLRHAQKRTVLTTKSRVLRKFHRKKTMQQLKQNVSQKLIVTTPSLLDISTKPTLVKKVHLQNRNQYLIQVPASGRGKLRGAVDTSNQYTLLFMESVGKSIVRLRGVESGTFLAMNKNGLPYISDVLNDECLFKERLKKNGFHTFSSYKYSGLNSGNAVGEWYLAIKKNGKFKLAVNTDQSQHSTHFTVIPVNINR